MDDLSGLEWTAGAKSNNAALKPATSNYSGFHITPLPAPSNTLPQPISRPSSTFSASRPPPVKTASPANDSFSNLLNLNSKKTNSNLTLQDRQKQLIEEKRRQEEEQRKRLDRQFSANNAHVWDNLGSGRGTPISRIASPPSAIGTGLARTDTEDVDNILAAFDSAAPVDRSSHFPPPPSAGASGRNTPAVAQSNGQSYGQGSTRNGNGMLAEDDDDPFGLGAMPARNTGASSQPVQHTEDDDILGDLSKPVTARPPQRAGVDETFGIEERGPAAPTRPASNPHDRAIAELVDMGFPADRSRRALDETDGTVQNAVGWLLNQAHEESRQKSRVPQGEERRRTPVERHTSGGRESSQRRAQGPLEGSMPAWMRQEGRPSSSQRKEDGRSPAPDAAKLASEFGTTLFKSAGSLWKAGQKQVQKAVADFQQEGGDTDQPKWMREFSADPQRATSRRPQNPTPQAPARHIPDVTDEALMLEARDARPQKPARPFATDPRRFDDGPPSRGRSPAQELPDRTASQSRFMQQQQSRLPIDKHPATKLSRLEVEEQSSQAYVSPARRKRPTPKVEPEPEVDLFSPAPTPSVPSQPTRPSQPTPAARTPVPATRTSAPSQPPRPKAVPRTIPSVSPTALSTSAQHRNAGTAAFKRGDYDAAHISYTSALNVLPSSHPLTIIILSNRALTAIKTGEPKTAISDADAALTLIGPARGEGETIDTGDGVKEMKEFFGKALMRKAEAMESMEKWSDAAGVWRECVEAGVGGAISLRGRDRCEKTVSGHSGGNGGAAATAVRLTSAKPAQPIKKAVTKPVARPALSSQASTEAVKKLRAANAAAEQADDEKFLLSDKVEARINGWKGGKADNLRALLGSLDTVLWAEAGWKKVGMSDLIIPGKVKIIYMKAIAKVHPDKIPQSATTEQKMVSASVFATLNEAWDKFKRDNGL